MFSSHDEDFGCTVIVKHQILTGSALLSHKWSVPPVPSSLAAELRAYVLNSVVVKESASPSAAPIVLVKNKGWELEVLC